MDSFETWLADISAKLNQQGKSLEDVLFDDSAALIQGKYRINTAAQAAYKEAIEQVMRWFLQGKCVFRFDDLNKPYFLHTIEIRWKTNEDDIELEIAELRKLCEKLNSNLIIDEKGEWQLGTVIFTEDRS